MLDLHRHTTSRPPGSTPRYQRRMCVRCGYEGRGVDDGIISIADWWCPNCGCDFLRRPPMSYAEMEGLYPREDVSLIVPGGPYRDARRSSSADIREIRRRESRRRHNRVRRLEYCLSSVLIAAVSMMVLCQAVYLWLSTWG